MKRMRSQSILLFTTLCIIQEGRSIDSQCFVSSNFNLEKENELIFNQKNSQLPKGTKPIVLDDDCDDFNNGLEYYIK